LQLEKLMRKKLKWGGYFTAPIQLEIN